MFWMIQMYDVLDQLEIRVTKTVQHGEDGQAMTSAFHRQSSAHRPKDIVSARDELAYLGEELIQMAHQGEPTV